MLYKKVMIYFMSGTGNSFRTASWIVEAAREKGADAHAVTIEDADPVNELMGNKDSLLGIVMPTHAFTAPWHMIRFIFKLPRQKSMDAFCITTRAGLKFGRVFTPGMSASANFIVAIMLALKGFRVIGVNGLDMPSNWISFHPGLHPESAKAIIGRAKIKNTAFMESIFTRKKKWFTGNNLYDLICACFLLPISVLYLILGRFYLAKVFFANNKCNNCGICVANCPVGAVQFKGKIKKKPYWRYNCESCMRCMAFCPERAVEAGHSWAVILYLITSIPVSVYLFAWLDQYIPGLSAINKSWIGDLINFLYIYPSMFISYYVFSQLIKIPIINTLFTSTTLTRIYRRYNEPDTKVKDLRPKKRA